MEFVEEEIVVAYVVVLSFFVLVQLLSALGHILQDFLHLVSLFSEFFQEVDVTRLVEQLEVHIRCIQSVCFIGDAEIEVCFIHLIEMVVAIA